MLAGQFTLLHGQPLKMTKVMAPNKNRIGLRRPRAKRPLHGQRFDLAGVLAASGAPSVVGVALDARSL